MNIQIDRFVKLIDNEIKISLLQRDVDYYSVVDTLEDMEKLLQNLDLVRPCPGANREGGIRSENCSLFLEPSGKKKRIPPRCHKYAEKKKSLAKKVRGGLQQKIDQAIKKKEKNNKIRLFTKKVMSQNKKDWPIAWQNAVLACVNASKAKSSKGRRYTTQWIYVCQLLRIKSLALYKKMLRHGFLPLPSLRTLQRYMKKLSPAYGFQKNIFAMMKEKSATMPESADRHGESALLVDEMKFSEGLWVDKPSLKMLGFVNLDQFTPEVQEDVPADHVLVMMLQAFKGQYFQSVSAHLSRGVVKGPELAKMILEATGLLEESGFFVDAIVSDAAAWNRNMWSQFGIKKLKYEKEYSKRSILLMMKITQRILMKTLIMNWHMQAKLQINQKKQKKLKKATRRKKKVIL
ncbi:hypothetical protein FOCC_FOCC015419 [Frankliniella occidentalis]|nr:hypothetical protein FOCC_FOCC015419 [Frankliniella occidentalis]